MQRYEATDYAAASLARIQEIVRALGIHVKEDVFLPTAKLSMNTLLSRLNKLGVDDDFVINRLILRSVVARLEA